MFSNPWWLLVPVTVSALIVMIAIRSGRAEVSYIRPQTPMEPLARTEPEEVVDPDMGTGWGGDDCPGDDCRN
jgi:hypothetical protein